MNKDPFFADTAGSRSFLHFAVSQKMEPSSIASEPKIVHDWKRLQVFFIALNDIRMKIWVKT